VKIYDLKIHESKQVKIDFFREENQRITSSAVTETVVKLAATLIAKKEHFQSRIVKMTFINKYKY
jgi:hypothetical protein